MKIISVVGARPNFMKIAPFIRAIDQHNQLCHSEEKIKHLLVHSGQHYDDSMSRTFFNELSIPDADINLGVGSGSHAEQLGHTMIAFEKVLQSEKPDWVVVVGDVNATLACSVTAKKECVKVCHIEAGLRSGDMTMPEEINRLVTDRLSDLLLTPDEISSANLRKEGTEKKRVELVGNIMIDTLDQQFEKAKSLKISDILKNNILDGSKTESDIPEDKGYAVVTLHRPSNVDLKEIFESILDFIIREVSKDMNVIWPIHPRAQKQLRSFGLYDELLSAKNIFITTPLGYLSMLRLNMGARLVLTDSGGLQEECTVLGTPCLTLRWNTERPVTLKEHGGASVLVGNNIDRIRNEYHLSLKSDIKSYRPYLWDGNTAERCLKAILFYKD